MLRLPRIAPPTLAQHACAILLLLLLPLVLLWPAVFGGKFPIETDGLFYEMPWEDARPESLPAADPGGPRTTIAEHYPAFLFLNDAAQSDASVQWNPREGYGVPHLAQWRTRALSPFSLPYYVFGLRAAMTLSLFAKLAVAGLTAFFAARVLRLQCVGALVVAVAFQLSPTFLLGWHSPVTDVAAWFPLLLLVFDRFGAGRTRVWPACAIVYALMLLGGDPETVVASTVFGVLYVFARTRLSDHPLRNAVTPAIVLGISLLAGAAMTAVQLLPFVEWLREKEAAAAGAAVHHMRVSDAVLSVLPRWHGAPTTSSIGGAVALRLESAGYWFLSVPLWLAIPLWLAMRGEVKPERRPLADSYCAGVAITATLGLIVSLAGTIQIGYLTFQPVHVLLPLALCASFVLAKSAQEWTHLGAYPSQDSLRRFVMYAVPVIVFWIVLALLGGANETDASRVMQFVVLLVMAFAFAAVLMWTLLHPSENVLSVGAIVLTGFGALYAFGFAQPFRSPDAIFPVTETVETLATNGSRMGGGAAAAAWPVTGNRIPNAAVAAGHALERQRQFERALTNDAALLPRTALRNLALSDQELEDVFAPVRDQLRIERPYAAGSFWVRQMNALPRARLAYAVRPVPFFEEVPINSQLPPVVEGGPALLGQAPSTGSAPAVYAAVDDPNRFDIDAAAPAVLIVAEAWYPGWSARVDGKETVVLPVDGLFRGVPVPAGTHRVEMIFASRSFQIGQAVSAFACIVITLAFAGRVWTILRRRKKLRSLE